MNNKIGLSQTHSKQNGIKRHLTFEGYKIFIWKPIRWRKFPDHVLGRKIAIYNNLKNETKRNFFFIVPGQIHVIPTLEMQAWWLCLNPCKNDEVICWNFWFWKLQGLLNRNKLQLSLNSGAPAWGNGEAAPHPKPNKFL